MPVLIGLNPNILLIARECFSVKWLFPEGGVVFLYFFMAVLYNLQIREVYFDILRGKVSYI